MDIITKNKSPCTCEKYTELDIKQFLDQLSLTEEKRNILSCLKEYDYNTYIHSIDVAMLTRRFMLHLGYGSNDLEAGTVAALLHDAGKLYVPCEIINKPGTLTVAERILIDYHTSAAAAVMKGCSQLESNAAIMHHTSYDKTAPFIQALSICDVYSANHLERAYKPMNSPQAALGSTLCSNILNPKLMDEFEYMWQNTPELCHNLHKHETPSVQHYEQKSLEYLAAKYKLDKSELTLLKDPHFVLYKDMVLSILDTDGTINGEPHEVELLGEKQLFGRDVYWSERDIVYPAAKSFERKMKNTSAIVINAENRF